MLVPQHFHMRLWQIIPAEHFGHAGVQTALQHQLVGRGRLFKVGKVASLQTFLVHPHIPHVQGQIEPGRSRTNHHHAALFTDKSGNRESRFTRVLKNDVYVIALASDLPDRSAKFARFFEPSTIFRRIHCGHLPPAIEIFAVQHTLGAQPHDKLAFVFVRDHPDGIGSGGVDQLDCIRSQPAGRAPNQHVLPRLQLVWVVPEQHSIGGCQCQCVTGAFLPSQVLGTWHQLLRLNAGELAKGAIGGFISPNALAGRKHRIAAVTFFVFTVILIAVDYDLVANLPLFDLVTNGPNNARSV